MPQAIEDVPPHADLLAHCHTPDCPAADKEFVVRCYENPGEPRYAASCGLCGKPITDLVIIPAGGQ
ncbi:hypothetical protein [Streptomyces rimosus]|uniref:hypothetical protein n=1 Tax=Streptomyces rimosus TaxID=1927 RepID=UPI00131E8578|nr:hypothetical protein [Streptomyces rimosus]